jgi:predicted small lipoprotein YifL
MKTTGLPASPMATRRFLTRGLALILCFAGAACGQRGPLFLPPQEPPAGSAPPAEVAPAGQAAQDPAEERTGDAADSDFDQELEGDEETP